jgi:FKBP-type peptidyl-prolyl cis-trans isomerase 2
MSEAKHGDTVKVHYKGTLDDGSQFDSSHGREPLEFVLGGGNLIPGFEQAVIGMCTGDTKTVTIPAGEAYGPHRPEMTQEIPRSAIPADIELAPGMVLHAKGPEGQELSVVVVSFDQEKVRIDGNHPLAGRDLTFELELVEVD